MKSYNSIVFMRHLKTLNNSLHIISGQSDSEIIRTEYDKADLSKFDRIYCSPSARCIDTINLVNNNLLHTNNVIYDERLLERDMGCLEGVSKIKCEIVYPDLFINGAFDVFKTPPQGESYRCFKARVRSFYDEYLYKKREASVLICSHNQTLKLLRLLLLDKEVTFTSWLEYSFGNGKLDEIYSGMKMNN